MAWGDLAAVGKLMTTLGQLSGVGSWQKGSGKSKGKKDRDKGKGKGKQVSSPSNDTDGCFQCRWDDCKAAEAQKVTWGWKTCCHGCGRAKGIAKSPPLERLAPWAYEERRCLSNLDPKDGGKDIGDKGKNKAATTHKADTLDAEKLAALRVDRMAGLKSAPAPTAQVAAVRDKGDKDDKDHKVLANVKTIAAPKAEKPEGDGNWAPGALDNVVMTLVTDDLPEVINEVLALVAADKTPQEFVPKETPEEALERHMKLAKVTPTSESKARVTGEVKEAKAQLEQVISMGASGDMLTPMRAFVAKKEEELRKLEKNSDTSTVHKAGLDLVKAALKKQREEAIAATERGMAKAAARKVERRRMVKSAQDIMLGLLRALDDHEAMLLEKHGARAAAIAEHETKIDQLLAAQATGDVKPAAPAQGPEVIMVAADGADPKDMQEKLDALTKEIEKMRAEAAAAISEKDRQLAALKVAEKGAADAAALTAAKQRAHDQFEKINFAAQETDLPGYEPTSGDQWKACTQLWALLNGWQMAGSQVGFTLLELADCAFAGREVALLGKNLLGPLWKSWMPENLADISADLVVPRQAATFMLIALQPLKEKFEDLQQHQKEVKTSLQKLHDNHKKRKLT